jgi:glycosyltransferase involved in cell wall biosynthesis
LAPLSRNASKKVLLVSNTGWSLYNFRRPLARALTAKGLCPVFVSPNDQYVEKLRAEGFEWRELEMHRRGLNPLAELLTLYRLKKIYAAEAPAAVHHFTIKCVLYGSVAAKLLGKIAVINSVTGLGHVFLEEGIKMRLLRPIVRTWYRLVLSGRTTRVIFQNPDDLCAFMEFGLIKTDSARLIRSSGVDVERFSPQVRQTKTELPIVLFIGRLLVEKGIFEFVAAVKKLAQNQVKARFVVAGAPDLGNPSSVPQETIEEWKQLGFLELKGHVDQIESLIAESSIVVLPSYREGVPRTLLEAAAMAKPLIATDVPGCREIVEDGKNGILVPPKNSNALADAISKLLDDPALITSMGTAGRQKVLAEFNDKDIAQAMLDVYGELGVVSSHA